MTKDEFEASWAEGSGFTMDEMRKAGFYAIPCDCEYEYCLGWAMKTQLANHEA